MGVEPSSSWGVKKGWGRRSVVVAGRGHGHGKGWSPGWGWSGGWHQESVGTQQQLKVLKRGRAEGVLWWHRRDVTTVRGGALAEGG